MKQIYFTVAGMEHYFGSKFVEAGMHVQLIKDRDNEYDTEAIRVEMEGLGKVGFVANSVRTRIGESMSAGRIYDKISETARGSVKYVLPSGVLCTLDMDAVRKELTADAEEEKEEDAEN